MAKFTASDLRQRQSLPLHAKIIMTQQRIRQWYDYWDGEVYLSFSGGKDSTVLRDLISKTSGVYDVPSVFCDTGLEYPEVRKFATERADVVIRPEMRFDEVIKTYGYPVISKEVAQRIYYAKKGSHWAVMNVQGLDNEGNSTPWKARYKKWAFLVDAPFSVSHYCCDVMKKSPFKKYETETGRKKFVGSLAAESQLRRSQWYKVGCNAFDGRKARSAPMSFWTEQDVLQYIKENDLPIASVYGDVVPEDGQMVLDICGNESPKLKTTGCDRTGCMFCMFGCHLEGEPNRFQRMKETHPRQYDYCMRPVEEKGLGLGEVLDYLEIPKE